MAELVIWGNRFTTFSSIRRLLIILSPAQLLASYPVVQVYQSYEFGPLIIQLPYMMAITIVVEAVGMILFLHKREGGK